MRTRLNAGMVIVGLALAGPFLHLTTGGARAQAPASPTASSQPNVLRERVPGAKKYPGEYYQKVTGKVTVINSHTLAFADGTEIELNGVIDIPEPEQQGRIDGKLYPCGQEAAVFLRKWIGDQTLTCFASTKTTNKLRGQCFVGETCLSAEMARQGWAAAHHSGMEAWEIIARENKRGLWRGEFVMPERWRKGERLPGE